MKVEKLRQDHHKDFNRNPDKDTKELHQKSPVKMVSFSGLFRGP